MSQNKLLYIAWKRLNSCAHQLRHFQKLQHKESCAHQCSRCTLDASGDKIFIGSRHETSNLKICQRSDAEMEKLPTLLVSESLRVARKTTFLPPGTGLLIDSNSYVSIDA
jgi:hypothetical protein